MIWCPVTDPAVEAAERATQPRGIPWAVGPGRYALHDLHQPAREGTWLVCAHCSRRSSIVRWPCDTAELVYADHELEAHQ